MGCNVNVFLLEVKEVSLRVAGRESRLTNWISETGKTRIWEDPCQ